jgi:polyisoprenyl-phosphate glycosyltransferase
MDSQFKYSVVVPVYKSTQSLLIMTEQLNSLVKESKFNFEVIYVNDSPFYLDTKNVLKQIEEQYSFVKVLTLRKNLGQHLATLAGILKSKGDYVITMDDDLQHPVSEIPNLIFKLKEDYQTDAVFGIPNYSERKHSLWRSVGSYVVKKMDLIFLNKPEGLMLSSFRIMTRDLADILIETHNAMPSISSLMVNATNELKNVKVQHHSREFGTTNYTLPKLINLTFNGILYYSSIPLRILGVVGFAVFILSIIFIIFIIIQKLFNGIEFPGYASTVSLISFFGGLNLFALGIIGEYLIRVIKEQKKLNLEHFIKESIK